ncbi:MAG: hypothetical protein J5525_13395 [Lachnospiraceae bacterium]|nr:hypothetical protein [Lachnospiraceae bacterium]
MNRTQRAIKKQYREAQMQLKNEKNREISAMKRSKEPDSPWGANLKQIHAENARKYQSEEKEARKTVIDYKNRANNTYKEAVGA